MYYLVFLILYIIFITNPRMNKKHYIYSFLMLSSLIIFKFGVGTDYMSYEYIYNNMNTSNLNEFMNSFKNIDIGYKLLMFPFLKYGISFNVFFSILNIIILFFITLWIYDNSSNYHLSLLLYFSMFFFVWVLSGVRQGLVISLILFLLYNNRFSFKQYQRLVIILLLSVFHKSVFIILFYELLSNIKWNKKKHLLVLVFSILINLLPLQYLINYVSKFSMFSTIFENYVINDYFIFDFPALVRFLFFIVVYLFYDELKKNHNIRLISDSFLLGISIYFLLKFSELIASRLTIYSLTMIVILGPEILKSLQDEAKKLKTRKFVIDILIASVVFLGSITYLEKELRTMASQSNYKSEGLYISYSNIFQNSYDDFNTHFSFFNNANQLSKQQILKDVPSFCSRKRVPFKEEDSYYIVENEGLYIALNQNGEILEKSESSSYYEIIKGIKVEYKHIDGKMVKGVKLHDLTEQNRSFDVMYEEISDYYLDPNYSVLKEERISKSFNVTKDFSSFFWNQNNIGSQIINKVETPFEYYIVRQKYLGYSNYIYLNKNFDPLFDLITPSVSSFDQQGFMRIRSYYGDLLINEEGEIIWVF